MKHRPALAPSKWEMSPPARGAWIETHGLQVKPALCSSPPARGAWIETLRHAGRAEPKMSPPARGAWIETPTPNIVGCLLQVAPRAGGVD